MFESVTLSVMTKCPLCPSLSLSARFRKSFDSRQRFTSFSISKSEFESGNLSIMAHSVNKHLNQWIFQSWSRFPSLLPSESVFESVNLLIMSDQIQSSIVRRIRWVNELRESGSQSELIACSRMCLGCCDNIPFNHGHTNLWKNSTDSFNGATSNDSSQNLDSNNCCLLRVITLLEQTRRCCVTWWCL